VVTDGPNRPDHIRRQVREFDSLDIQDSHETCAKRIIRWVDRLLRARQGIQVAIAEVALAPLEDELVAEHEVSEDVLRSDS
jgi:hypothetical protein